ncbi:MAG: response regulator [Planctomycetota bacterium]|nr:MAG: response regulator [Planctomycetota bacterium]
MFDDPRLLVIDDEQTICQGCQRIFSSQGFRVETSDDAPEGLRLAEANNYAVILLDIKMPSMSGIEFLAELRKVKPDVPVIIITGYPNTSDVLSAMRLGAVDYITKPFVPEKITETVQRLLRQQRFELQVPANGEFNSGETSWSAKNDSLPAGLSLMYPQTESVAELGIWEKSLIYGLIAVIGALIGSMSGGIVTHFFLMPFGIATFGPQFGFDLAETLIGIIGVFGGMTIGIACSFLLVKMRLIYRDPPGHCNECGYNLSGNVSGICPECGVSWLTNMSETLARLNVPVCSGIYSRGSTTDNSNDEHEGPQNRKVGKNPPSYRPDNQFYTSSDRRHRITLTGKSKTCYGNKVMVDDPRLLVVDDEESICQGCQRIFSRQGFMVETSRDACEGLSLASEKNYDAILLDIKMPTMDGIMFLQELRKAKPDVPVIIITGYPNIPNAVSAMRLGASDFITKPFTPEQITQTVKRLLKHQRPNINSTEKSNNISTKVATADQTTSEFRFWDESWIQVGNDGLVRVGAMLTSPLTSTFEGIYLPKVGEEVYQGLPLAALIIKGKAQCIIPAPVSGAVADVNSSLREDPSTLWNDPFGRGWIARISAKSFEEEVNNCTLRQVILANSNKVTALEQSKRLTSLGCCVCIISDSETLQTYLHDNKYKILFIDAASFGENGPQLIQLINEAAPSSKIVVFASPSSQWEAAYREGGIFYYAVEPFTDNEIIDVLDAAFCPMSPGSVRGPQQTISSQSVNKIDITNRNGTNVCLMATGGWLRKDDGLGWQIRHKLLDRGYPIETTLGNSCINTVRIMKAVGTCDHLFILTAKDMDRIPGSLFCDTDGKYLSLPPESIKRVTALMVQTDSSGSSHPELDGQITAALAEHIARELESC